MDPINQRGTFQFYTYYFDSHTHQVFISHQPYLVPLTAAPIIKFSSTIFFELFLLILLGKVVCAVASACEVNQEVY
jgi:hypothetical protein